MESALERRFDLVWRAIAGPQLEREHRFAAAIGRRWRIDRAWIEEKAAFELEGGTWTGGRHTRGSGFRDDCEKYNAAGALGWRVFRLTGEMLTEKYLEALLSAIREGRGINFRFARKGGHARRYQVTPKWRFRKCNSHRH